MFVASQQALGSIEVAAVFTTMQVVMAAPAGILWVEGVGVSLPEYFSTVITDEYDAAGVVAFGVGRFCDQQAEEVTFGDHPNHLVMFYDGQPAEFMRHHHLSGFEHGGIGCNGYRITRHAFGDGYFVQQRTPLVHAESRGFGRLRCAKIAPGDDPNQSPVLDNGEPTRMALRHNVLGFSE